MQVEGTTPRQWTKPLFVYIYCKSCRRYKKLESYKTGFITDSKDVRHRSVYGPCPKCGKELAHRIDTDAYVKKLVIDTQAGFLREQEQKENKALKESAKVPKKKDRKKTMPKTKTKKTADKAKVKKTKKTAEAKTTKKAKAKKSEAVERTARYGPAKEGMPNGKEGMISIIDGEFKTVEQFNKDYAKAAKAGKVRSRPDGWKTTDLSWLLNNADEVVAGYDEDGERVYGANLKVKNGKVGKMKVATSTAELKTLKP